MGHKSRNVEAKTMTTSPVTLTDAVRNAILYNLNGIHTSFPAEIVTYDYVTQSASVQPTINKSWTDGTFTPMPILSNVPVIFPASGGASITFPVNTGDTCLIVCCERSIDEWLSTGGLVDPRDPRKLNLTDAVAIMGLVSFSGTFPPRTNNTDAIFTYAGSSITITNTGAIKINTATTLALGQPTNELINQLNTFFTALAADTNFTGLIKTATLTALTLLIANLTALDGTLP
jgi:Phage protein Gp138 N-terminal domain